MSRSKPRIGVIIGDACGIGPEVTVKCWLTGQVHEASIPVLFGSTIAVEQALRIVGSKTPIKRLHHPGEATGATDVIELIDDFPLAAGDIHFGRQSTACGYVTGMWLEQAEKFVGEGALGAMVLAPIDTGAMVDAGVINRLTPIAPGIAYNFLMSGPLRIAHLTDHIPLSKVEGVITSDLVVSAVSVLSANLKAWGIADPRIAVAGFNPHAHGEVEEKEIAPGVAKARAQGCNVAGPISPDAVFRQCIEDKYDAVLALYHDQGHIPIKTWGFAGNCVVVLGKPFPYLSVGHGVAHDIAGKGIADHSMLLSALITAGYFAAGRGFPEFTSAAPR